jgi:hypothetical protein
MVLLLLGWSVLASVGEWHFCLDGENTKVSVHIRAAWWSIARAIGKIWSCHIVQARWNSSAGMTR